MQATCRNTEALSGYHDVLDHLSAVIVDCSSFTLPYDYALCNALVQQGCLASLVCSEFLHEDWKLPAMFQVDKLFYRLTHAYARTHRRGTLWKIAKGIEHIFCTATFAAKIRKRAPDIIHFQWLPLPVIDGLFLRSLHRIVPLVLTLHNSTMCHGVPSSHLQSVGFGSALKYFDAVIVHSQFTRVRLLELGWAESDKIHVIPHGIFDYYGSLDCGDEHAAATDNIVLFFGNLKPYKGVDVLIRALAQLPERILQRSRVVIAGKPMMDVDPLRKLAQSLNVEERIVWRIGHVEEKHVAALFRRAAVVVLPYREIDQSGVLMTAVAFGKPVVASRVGGIPEIIRDGIHGCLVEPGDAGGLSTALESVLTHPERAYAMGRANRELCKGELSWDAIAQKTVALYSRLCRRSVRQTCVATSRTR